jgi:hypothetical protein
VLKTIFEPENDKSTAGRKKLCNENFHDWYYSRNVSEVITSGLQAGTGHAARVEKKMKCIQNCNRTNEGKILLEKQRRT